MTIKAVRKKLNYQRNDGCYYWLLEADGKYMAKRRLWYEADGGFD